MIAPSRPSSPPGTHLSGKWDVFCEMNRFASVSIFVYKGFPDVFCELGPLADEAIDFSWI